MPTQSQVAKDRMSLTSHVRYSRINLKLQHQPNAGSVVLAFRPRQGQVRAKLERAVQNAGRVRRRHTREQLPCSINHAKSCRDSTAPAEGCGMTWCLSKGLRHPYRRHQHEERRPSVTGHRGRKDITVLLRNMEQHLYIMFALLIPFCWYAS